MLEAPYILLAEDSDDDNYFAQRCFAASDIRFELRRCTDGSDVVRHLESCGSDLPRAIILDLKMPLMDGFETLEWIRRHAACRSMTVVILSSSGLAEDRERARLLGASEYLVKPHSLGDLEKMLKDLAMRLATPPSSPPGAEGARA